MPSGQNPPSGQSGDATRLPAPKNEPPTRVVDAFLPRRSRNIDRGTECLKAGRPGFWCVLACTRRVSLSTRVEMIGAQGRDVALFQASDGSDRESHITTGEGGGKGIWLGVDIAQGASPLEGCEITSQSIACVGIRGGANPPGCSATAFHHGKMLAAMWTTTARGALEDNDIFGNAFSAVEIKME